MNRAVPRHVPIARHRKPDVGALVPRMARLAAGLVIAGLCVLMVVFGQHYRNGEALLAASWMQGIIPGGTQPLTDHILMYAGMNGMDAGMNGGASTLIALKITLECASYVVLVPFLLLAGFLIAATRVTWTRWFVGALAGGVGILVVNQLRLWLIVFSTNRWGISPGYEISHRVVGSIIGLCGFTACFVVTLWIMKSKNPGAQPDPPHPAQPAQPAQPNPPSQPSPTRPAQPAQPNPASPAQPN